MRGTSPPCRESEKKQSKKLGRRRDPWPRQSPAVAGAMRDDVHISTRASGIRHRSRREMSNELQQSILYRRKAHDPRGLAAADTLRHGERLKQIEAGGDAVDDIGGSGGRVLVLLH